MRRIVTALLLVFMCCGMYAQRERVCFDDDWRFHFGNAADPAKDFGCGTEYFNYLTKANSVHNEGPYCNKFDDKDWKKVNLPFDFVVDLPFAGKASHSHGYKQVGYKYPETSVGWYRKTFTIAKEDEGKHFEILFDGIFRDSRVWVNGFYCGGECSGYLSQSYDITDYLNYGGENIVCVRADATLEEGWFYEGGGIYRHTWLTKTDPVHICQDGLRITTQFKGGNYDKALVNVTADIQNASHEIKRYAVKYSILDAEGNVIDSGDSGRYMDDRHYKGTPLLPFNTKEKSHGDFMTINNPHLWSVDTPYLYTMVAEVIVDEKVVDTYKEKFGVREVKFDKDRGFLLNGKEVKLKGVNLHQDHAGVGAGIPDAVLVYRIKKLKELGCNAYRSSHNPMSPAMLDVCDSLGMLVIDENRLSGISEYEISSLEKMIKRDKNHPSIILWSAGNEEWGIEWDKKGEKIAETMRDYCHIFDPSREMTFATSGGPTVEVPVDVAGYNYVTQNPIEEHRKNYPERKCYGSEETTGCGARGVYFDDHKNGYMQSLNRIPDERDGQMNRIQRGWNFYANRPWAAGCFFWTGFDYRGESNPMVFPATNSQFGILDYCGFPKDEAYYLKAAWTDEPLLHILPHWNLKGHEGEEIAVWAYSNCDEVELFVNGKSQGKKAMPKNEYLEWKTIYKPGKLVAVGYKNGKKVVTEKVETTGEAIGVKLNVESLKLNEKRGDGDVVVYDIDLVDKKGRFVPDACNELTVTVDGDILGWGNGDPTFQHVERPTNGEKAMTIRAFNGHAQVIVKGTAEIRLK